MKGGRPSQLHGVMEFRQASDWGRLSRTKVGKAMGSDFGRTTLENRKSVYPRRTVYCRDVCSGMGLAGMKASC